MIKRGKVTDPSWIGLCSVGPCVCGVGVFLIDMVLLTSCLIAMLACKEIFAFNGNEGREKEEIKNGQPCS
jgi:hypothetical protein